MFNKKADGSNWTNDEKSKIWWDTTTPCTNAKELSAEQNTLYRVDKYGNLLYWHHYGNRQEKMGWEIDHKLAKSKGGLSIDANLQALQWEVNNTKSDDSEGINLTAKLKAKGLSK